MKDSYIVTEENCIVDILKKILPDRILQKTGFFTSRYSVHSTARTILVSKRVPVALLVESNTINEQAILDRKESLEEIIQYASANTPYKIFMVVPEIEVLFFENASFIEKLTNHKIPPMEWKLAKSLPKKYLGEFNITSEIILGKLDRPMIERIRKHPLIVGLTDFLTSVIIEKNGAKRFAKQELVA